MPSGLAGLVARGAAVLRRLIGAPDYATYCAHVAAHQPGTTPMGRREFSDARLAQRYDRPGSRCC